MNFYDEDWIKRQEWDLPATFAGLQRVIGPRPADVAQFLTLDAARAMPHELLVEVVAYLDGWQARSSVPAWARRTINNPPPARPSAKSAVGEIQFKAGRVRLEPYDPDAEDGDGDGLVQDGTPWERPAGTRLLDAAGQEIAKGRTATIRPPGTRVVDRDGNDVDYTPKDAPEVPEPQGIGGISGPQPKLQSLKDQGLPTVSQIVNPEPAKPAKPARADKPDRLNTPARNKPDRPATSEPIGEIQAFAAGITAGSTEGIGPRPEKPRAPYQPAPPPLTGIAQDLAEGVESWSAFGDRLEEFVVIDYETTGLQDGNMPVQVGAVRIRNGEVVERFNVFTNPEWPLGKWSRENLLDADGNPLTDEWLAEQADLADTHRQLTEFIGDSIVVAHNYPFDGEILERMLAASGDDWEPAGTIDSLELLRQIMPADPDGVDGPTRHGLGVLAEYFDVPLGDKAHRADADAEAAGMVLRAALDATTADSDLLTRATQEQRHADAMDKYNKRYAEYLEKLDAWEIADAEWLRSATRSLDGDEDGPAELPQGKDLPAITTQYDIDDENATFAQMRDFFEDLAGIDADRDAPWRTVTVRDVDGVEHTIQRGIVQDREDTKMRIAHELGLRMRDDPEVTDDALLKFLRQANPHDESFADMFLSTVDGRLNQPVSRQGERNVQVSPDDSMYRELVAEAVASHLVHKWAESSNDANPLSLMIQDAVEELFGLEDVAEWDYPTRDAWEDHRGIVNAFVRAQYANTQERLAAAGITEVVLHRGMKYEEMDPASSLVQAIISADAQSGRFDDEQISLRPLSSFAFNEDEAVNFGGADSPVMLVARVPAERIFSTAVTGTGCLGEDEVVVLGGGTAKFNVTWEFAEWNESYRAADDYQSTLTENAPKWLTDAGWEFNVDGDLWDYEMNGVYLHNNKTGARFFLGAFDDQAYWDPEAETDITVPDFSPATWTQDQWTETFGHLDQDPDAHVPIGVAAINDALPNGWVAQWDGTGHWVKIAEADDFEAGAIDTILGKLELTEVALHAALNPEDLRTLNERTIAMVVQRTELQDVIRRLKLTPEWEDLTRRDPTVRIVHQHGTSAIDHPDRARTDSIITVMQDEKSALRIVGSAVPGVSREQIPLPGLDGAVTVERKVGDDWVPVGSVPQNDIYESPAALERAVQLILDELYEEPTPPSPDGPTFSP